MNLDDLLTRDMAASLRKAMPGASDLQITQAALAYVAICMVGDGTRDLPEFFRGWARGPAAAQTAEVGGKR